MFEALVSFYYFFTLYCRYFSLTVGLSKMDSKKSKESLRRKMSIRSGMRPYKGSYSRWNNCRLDIDPNVIKMEDDRSTIEEAQNSKY